MQTVKAFTRLVLTIFALGLFVAYVGVDQSLHKFTCLIVPPETDNLRPFPDAGRLCEAEGEITQEEAVQLCYSGPEAKKGVKYQCEKPGMFTTSSIDGGRVRYLGVLSDPSYTGPGAESWRDVTATVIDPSTVALHLTTPLGGFPQTGEARQAVVRRSTHSTKTISNMR